MKGRWTYDGLNQAIEEYNNALETRYNFLAKGFQAMASVSQKKKYKVKATFYDITMRKFNTFFIRK